MSWLCSLAFVPGCWSLIVDPHVTKDVSPSAPSSATASGATKSARSAVATATGSEERGIWSAGRIRERAGDAGGRARARKRLLRARGDVRGEVRERGLGNSSPAFGGSPTERRPPLVVQTNSRSSSRAALVRPPRLTSAVIKLRAGNAPTSSPPRRAPLGPARTRRPRTFARDAEPPLAQPDAAFGERGALPRRRVRPLSLSTLPLSPSRAAPPRLTEPSRPFIRTTDSAAAASSRAARRGCYPLESCAPR